MKFKSLAQKIIFSITSFCIGLIISIAISQGLYYNKGANFSDTWWIWVLFILIQYWLQNQVWTTNEVNFRGIIESSNKLRATASNRIGGLKFLKTAVSNRIGGFKFPKFSFRIPSIYIWAFFVVIGMYIYLYYKRKQNFYQTQFTSLANYSRNSNVLPITPKYENYAAKELEEFRKGHKVPYLSDISGKAKGLMFMISYPLSYNVVAVDRPNVVAKISSPNLRCDINLLVKKFPEIITDEQKEMALSTSTLIAATNAMGLQMLSSDQLFLDGEKAAYTDCYIERSDGAVTYRCFKRTYYTYYKNYALEIHFNIGGNEEKEILRKRFSDYKPLFSMVVNSLTLITTIKH